jgi:hypothetical protein
VPFSISRARNLGSEWFVSVRLHNVLEHSFGNFAIVSVEEKENSEKVLASQVVSVTPVEPRVRFDV